MGTATAAEPENEVEDDVETCFYKAPCRFGSGSWNKTGGKLSCRIASKMMSPNTRDECLVNASLQVRLSMDPETNDAPPLPGMGDAYESLLLRVRVTQYSKNSSDVCFSMAFDQADMPAQFLKSIAYSAGSIYVLDVSYLEDKSAEPGDDEDSEE